MTRLEKALLDFYKAVDRAESRGGCYWGADIHDNSCPAAVNKVMECECGRDVMLSTSRVVDAEIQRRFRRAEK